MKTVIDSRGLVSSQGPDEFVVNVPMTLNGALSRLIVSSETVTTSSTVLKAVTLVDASAGNIQITLPDASVSTGATYTLKKIDATANTVTITGVSSQTIDGTTDKTISTQWTSITLIASNDVWYII